MNKTKEMKEIQKIKAEIERLKNSGCASPVSVCDDLLNFIDSLSQEPADKEEDAKSILERCTIDPTKDYRAEIRNFYLEKDGSLVWQKYRNYKDPSSGKGDTYVIDAERLTEPDWISHMFGKMDYELFGEFVGAYLKALERRGVKKLEIDIKDFDIAQKFPGEERPF